MKRRKFNAAITAFGKHLPETKLTNLDLEKMVETSDEWIRSRTGISERRIVKKGEATSHMSIKAVEDMISRFNVDPAQIDLIIVATVTPDMMFPATACLIQDKIKARKAWGFDLSGACSGFLYALYTGAQFIENGSHSKILIVGADTMSSIVNYRDRNTCVLFGDGAGVVLLEPTERKDYGIIDFIGFIDGSGGPYLSMPAGGSIKPASIETIEKGMHFIQQDGRAVFKFAVNAMADVSQQILERNNLKGNDIKIFIPHQANKRIIEASAKKMKLNDSQVLINIDKYANTTAATIPIGIVEAHDEDRIRNGDLMLLASFGAGFTWGSLLLRWGY